MAGLGVTAAVVEEVLVEFVSGIPGRSGSLMGSYEANARLLACCRAITVENPDRNIINSLILPNVVV